jgi:hypothetical protein
VAAEIGRVTFESVQTALDASMPGDTVLVCPGVHPGGLYYSHLGPLTIVGDPANPNRVVLDGAGTSRVLFGAYGSSLSLDGLTFRGGATSPIWIDPVTGFNFGAHGGALNGSLERIIINNSLFYDNTAKPAGTGGIGGAVNIESASIRISNTEFRGNEADSGGCVNISVIGGSATFENVSFLGCSSVDGGGAIKIFIAVYPDQPLPTIPIGLHFERVSFRDNAGGNDGVAVGIYKRNPTFGAPISLDASFTDVEFIDNRADMGWFDDYHAYGEGTVHIDSEGGGDVVRFERALFSGNQAQSLCGIYAWARRTRDPVYPAPRLEVRDSTFLPCVPSPYDEGTHLFVMDHWSAIYENVDVGSGPTANPGGDFGRCLEETDGVVSGEVHPLLDDWCP